MTIGTEHEYSINDQEFRPLPISDLILSRLAGRTSNEAALGEIVISKELQKHVLEVVPAQPGSGVAELEACLLRGMERLWRALGEGYRLLGLGMHPLLTLDQTSVWDREEGEIYREYDRLFGIRQHGWLNIQALQVNIPYREAEELVGLHNRIRALLPYLIAISAASPIVEGRRTGCMDNRLFYYQKNQERIPEICHGIIPERLRSMEEYLEIQECYFSRLRAEGAEILCREWVNSRGVIVRFSRRCLEIKALDEQECIRSDMSITAFLLALLRQGELELQEDENDLKDLTRIAMERGVSGLRPELRALFSKAAGAATPEEKPYLPLVQARIEHGSLAELMDRQIGAGGGMKELLESLSSSLRQNRAFLPSGL